MKSQDFGAEVTVVRTVFLRKVNVAAAAFLIFLSIQGLVTTLFSSPTTAELAVGIALIPAALVYGFAALNSYMSKIFVYERGLIIKSLLSKKALGDADIKRVGFYRANMRKMQITIVHKTGKPITINTAKYQNYEPVVEYLKKFKQGPTPAVVLGRQNAAPTVARDTQYNIQPGENPNAKPHQD
ncbi:MAG: hypothetical protein FWC93_03390 [Defluviitaleaceae bacterium]|nr:hypothetical protein [Defluviitaleaceae bacterium]